MSWEQEISEMLQSGEYDLDMSIKLYEEGVQIVSFCNKSFFLLPKVKVLLCIKRTHLDKG